MAALVVLALPIFWLTNLETTDSYIEPSPTQANVVASNVELPSDETKSETIEPLLILQSTQTPQYPDQANLAQTLEGTEIDGALKTDATGQLILDQEVRDFFDYFLSTADEIGPEASIAEIRRYVSQYLPEPGRTQAQELFTSYLKYKRFELNIEQTPISQDQLSDVDTLSILKSSFDRMKAERRNLFTSEQHQALFGLEENYQDYTLASLEILADQHTNDAQKRASIEELQAQLPLELQHSQQVGNEQKESSARLSQLAQTHPDDSDYHNALIAEGISEDKSAEMVAYRQSQRQFDKDYQAYHKAASKLDPESASYAADKEALINSWFATPELRTQAKLSDLKNAN